MTFLVTLAVFVLTIAAMSVGVIFGRSPITGSCGGLGAVGIDQECKICGGNPQRCEGVSEREVINEYDPKGSKR